MNPEHAVQRILATGAIATATTTAAVAALGLLQSGSAAAPLNATSHIVWGADALRHDRADLAHTALGAALNAGAMLSWAAVQHLVFPRPRRLWSAVAIGTAVSALAYVTDYHVVPKRLTPGFEARLSRAGLLGVYVSLAAALAAGAWLTRRRGG